MSLVIRTEAIIQLFLSIKESGEVDQPYLLYICPVCHPTQEHFKMLQSRATKLAYIQQCFLLYICQVCHPTLEHYKMLPEHLKMLQSRVTKLAYIQQCSLLYICQLCHPHFGAFRNASIASRMLWEHQNVQELGWVVSGWVAYKILETVTNLNSPWSWPYKYIV